MTSPSSVESQRSCEKGIPARLVRECLLWIHIAHVDYTHGFASLTRVLLIGGFCHLSSGVHEMALESEAASKEAKTVPVMAAKQAMSLPM